MMLKFPALMITAATCLFADKLLPSPVPTADPPSICDAVAGNLVQNCGFEAGTFADWIISGGTPFDFVVTGNFAGFDPNSGRSWAALGSLGADTLLTQGLNTTPGTTYTISWYLGSDGLFPNDFSATWNGATLFSQTNVPSTGGAYVLHTASAIATGNSTTLGFASRNDLGFLALDDITVVAAGPNSVPEPSSVLLLLSTLSLVGIRLRRKL